jgi:copper transport protein
VRPGRHRVGAHIGHAVAVALLVLLIMPAIASAHAILVASDPPMNQATPTAPAVVRLQFSEPVTLLNPSEDCQVVSATGASIESAPCHVSTTNVRELDAPIMRHVAPGTYTVRYQVVSADSHVVGAALPFAIGTGSVGLPYLGNRPGQGPSETSAWEVSARALEYIGLGGLLAIIAFRWLVWGAVWRPNGRHDELSATDRQSVLDWGRDLYWTAFGILAIGAMLAEGYLLVVYSATVLGTSVTHAAGDSSGIGTVLSSTRFGSLIQYRGALLFVVFAIGAWQYLAEFGSGSTPRPASAAGRPVPGVLMALAVTGVLWGIASEGHASQAPLPVVQKLVDLAHLGSAAIWVGGLALTIVILWRLPRAIPIAGDAIATDVLVRFSRVALIAVAVIVATGVIRTFGELDSPSQLWSTAYGATVLAKVGLLSVAGVIALRNRRITNTLAHRRTTHRDALASVRNAAMAELVLGVGIVVVAAILVAELPGRVA